MPLNPNDDIEEVEDIGLDSPASDDDGENQNNDAMQIGAGGYSIAVDNRALPYVGIVICAIILLIAVCVPSFDFDNRVYGIVASSFSMFFGLLGAFMILKNQALYNNDLGNYPAIGSVSVGNGLAKFLFLWNIIAAAILTFDAPFTVTSNGYFAAWGGVMFALMAQGVTTEAVKNRVASAGLYNGLLVASVIQMAAIIKYLGDDDGRAIYSLVLSILTIILVLAIGAYPTLDPFKLPIFGVFSILWIVMACFVTFKGPFLETGNGYFSAWIGALLSIMITASQMGISEEEAHL